MTTTNSSGKKKRKRFPKILVKKHHTSSHHSHIDGEAPSKLRRSHSEGSSEDTHDSMDVIDVEDYSADEEIFDEETMDSFQVTSDEYNDQDKQSDDEMAV